MLRSLVVLTFLAGPVLVSPCFAEMPGDSPLMVIPRTPEVLKCVAEDLFLEFLMADFETSKNSLGQ